MSLPLDDAMKRLENALNGLESTIARRLSEERRRGDLETELQLMQDDRARLADELDGAMARVRKMDAATSDASDRVRRAMGAIEHVLAGAGDAAAE